MRFGEIIRRAWHITWRYRWLWILGMFAGITGGTGGGGGSGGSSSYSKPFGSGTGGSSADLPDMHSVLAAAQHWLPFILIVLLLLFLIGIAFAIISIGARGGLVWAVNEIEEGRAPTLGESWNAGFGRFWSIFGLGVLLQLPIVLAGLLMALLVLAPIVGPLMRGDSPDAAMVVAPVCGVLAIGLPLLFVAGLVLGVMYITGVRFVVLDGMGTTHAAGESWRALRARLGDHALMYVISFGLSLAAGFALAIPIIVLSVVTIVPAVVAAMSKSWGVFAALIGVFTLLIVMLGLAFSAVWGTFTSAMWTIFFRRLTGREVVAAMPVRSPAPMPGQFVEPTWPPPPPAPGYPQPAEPVADPTVAPSPQPYAPAPAMPSEVASAPVAPPMYVPPAPVAPAGTEAPPQQGPTDA